MTLATMTRARIVALFVITALIGGSMQTRMPDLQRQLGLNDGQLGLALMGMPLGALVSYLGSSRLVERFGTIISASVFLSLTMLVSALATIWLHPVVFFLLLCLFGASASISNIAINVEADRIEAASGERVMNFCHGAWSLGFLAISLTGAAVRGAGVPPAVHLWIALPILIGLLALIAVPMRAAAPRGHTGTAARPRLAGPTWAVAALVAFGFGAELLEGAARSWSIIFLRDSFTIPAWIESLALPALMLAMALGRLVADPLIDRFGPVRFARMLLSTAIVGLVVLVFSPSYPFGILGFALIGLGACAIYPLMLSAAARIGDRPASENVASTTLIIQLAMLGSPVLIGGAAQGFGIRAAFGMMMPLLILGWVMAGALRPRQPVHSSTA